VSQLVDKDDELFRAIGRIEGKLDQALPKIESLTARVTTLEKWQAWLKGAWFVIAAAFVYLFKGK
jgi:hypothetical protein